MELTSIPGVGEKTAEALQELPDPERALRDGDIAALARAPGISDGRAARIAREAIRESHDDPGDFLATPRAREIYQDALSLVQAHAVTTYATRRLETLYPSGVESRIDEVRERSREALEYTPNETVREALEAVEPLTDPGTVRVRDRCLATGDAERYARAREAVPELSVELVDDTRQLAELGRGYATVIVLDEAFGTVDVDGDVRVEPDALEDPEQIVPERTLSLFAENRRSLRAAVRVHRHSDLDASCDLDALETALAQLDEDGTVRGDDELDRLSRAVTDIDGVVSEAEDVANDHLRTAIETRDVTIDGTDLLSLVERGAGVDSLLQRELATEYEDAIEQARTHLVETLELTDTESLARRVFVDDPTYPVEHDDDALGRLRDELTATRDRRAASRKRSLAGTLAEMREGCEVLVDQSLEHDVTLAISGFAREFDCTMATMEGRGFDIEGGRSPLLDVSFEETEPIDYHVEGVTLLSGVNSGGKTSTLDLVALVVTLAHMGLPVPAERARVERIGQLHYHAKSQGTLDAGAFESTVRDFGELVTETSQQRRTLVLVDELESITEPGASAKIMAGILEALSRTDTTAVFVSHLAREIRDTATVEISVDGIEADGLVDGELQVERSPVKGRLARSTPELIVEKLADDGNDGETIAFYTDLLEKFR